MKFFKKKDRLLKRSDFRGMPKPLKGRFILIQRRPSAHPRLGITVTRRFGNACQRNRFKRIVREAFRQSTLPNFDYNIRPLSPAREASTKEIAADLELVWLPSSGCPAPQIPSSGPI